MRKELFELFNDIYKRTVEDNKEDFMEIIGIISKLCCYLIAKNILTQEEVSKILDIDIDMNSLFSAEKEE